MPEARGSADVDRFVLESPATLRPVVEELRRVIQRSAPQFTETMKWSQPCYVGRKKSVYLAVFADHVNLGFFEGARLKDPDGRLEGTGKGLRHVKVRSRSEADEPALAELIRAAAALDGG